MNNKIIAGAVAAAVIGMSPITASAINFKDVMAGKADFSIGGYVKLSVMSSDYSEGNPAGGNSTIDTFYFPGAIPVGGSGNGDNNGFDMTARETRINFKISQKIDGHSVMGYIETDFMASGDGSGNEVISNSYNPRLRHAFIKFDNWTFGQTWSTYMDVGALPESVDFLAAAESTVFVRQPMIRYSVGGFQVAIENPESFDGQTDDRDNSELPDLIANYTMKGDWGHARVSGMVREIQTESFGSDAVPAGFEFDPATGGSLPTAAVAAVPASDDSDMGWGIGFTGKLMVGKDDLKFSVNHGEGLGRYIGLALPRDSTTDANGDIELSETTAFFVAYRHWWTETVRSSIIYSDLQVDYDDSAIAANYTSDASSVAVNLMYSPIKPLTLGVMYITGERETENGDDGDLDRIQVSAKYAF